MKHTAELMAIVKDKTKESDAQVSCVHWTAEGTQATLTDQHDGQEYDIIIKPKGGSAV